MDDNIEQNEKRNWYRIQKKEIKKERKIDRKKERKMGLSKQTVDSKINGR